MADRVLAWNWLAGGCILSFVAFMTIVGGLRFRSKPDHTSIESTSYGSKIMEKYYEINDRWRKSRFYLVWIEIFSTVMAMLAIYFFWTAWTVLAR
jgi:hypothetical protein